MLCVNSKYSTYVLAIDQSGMSNVVEYIKVDNY